VPVVLLLRAGEVAEIAAIFEAELAPRHRLELGCAKAWQVPGSSLLAAGANLSRKHVDTVRDRAGRIIAPRY
jgi:hypothetical protein